jgi:hypothetical protein
LLAKSSASAIAAVQKSQELLRGGTKLTIVMDDL